MASVLKRHYFKDRSTNKLQPLDGRCRKHPKHRQSPGVCSLCLGEKLSQLANTNPNSRRANISTTPDSSTTSSLSSYYSSSSGSSCSSPMQCRYRTSTFMSGNINVLKKSRSIAFAFSRSTRSSGANNKDGCDVHDQIKAGKSTGFWSKLLSHQGSKRITTGRQEIFMHSRTVRERVH